MRLKLDIRPDLVAMMRAEIAAGERAVTAAMREAGAGLKLAWRGQITDAGLGPRLANSMPDSKRFSTRAIFYNRCGPRCWPRSRRTV